jgi:hypothetical protein
MGGRVSDSGKNAPHVSWQTDGKEASIPILSPLAEIFLESLDEV